MASHSFAGTLAADGSVTGGRFTLDGTDSPLVLHRATEPSAS